MNLRAIPVISLLALAATAIAQDATHSLETNAKKDSSVWLVEETKQKQVIDMAGQEMTTSNTITRFFSVKVVDVTEDGNRVVETEFVRVRGSISVPMLGDFDFDSADPKGADEDDGMGGMGPGQMIKQLSSQAGQKFNAKIGKHGQIVGSLDEVAKELRAKHPDSNWNAGAMKAMVETAFGKRPKEAVAIGAKWKFDNDPTGGLPVKQTAEATLTKVDAESFETAIAGTMEKDAKAAAGGGEEPGMADMAESMTIRNGKVVGTQRVSRMDGFLVSSKSRATGDITMETPMGEMTMAVEIETTVKRTSKADAMPKPAKKADDAGGKK